MGIEGINVGGGPFWEAPGWINLEEVVSEKNPNPFYLHPHCLFPAEEGSLQNIYTSHALEHLPETTVLRILSESFRCLKDQGNLVIKIPDYDQVLDCWRKKDASFFQSQWGIEGVVHTWRQKGICDCLDHRAAMILCSFFHRRNPFGPAKSKEEASPLNRFVEKCRSRLYRLIGINRAPYFGPPIVDVPFLQQLIQDPSHTPSSIAKELCQIIQRREKNFHFCHQSAWSRDELQQLLYRFGFEIVSFDPTQIIASFPSIPDIATMKEMSLFCWARKIAKNGLNG